MNRRRGRDNERWRRDEEEKRSFNGNQNANQNHKHWQLVISTGKKKKQSLFSYSTSLSSSFSHWFSLHWFLSLQLILLPSSFLVSWKTSLPLSLSPSSLYTSSSCFVKKKSCAERASSLSPYSSIYTHVDSPGGLRIFSFSLSSTGDDSLFSFNPTLLLPVFFIVYLCRRWSQKDWDPWSRVTNLIPFAWHVSLKIIFPILLLLLFLSFCVWH